VPRSDGADHGKTSLWVLKWDRSHGYNQLSVDTHKLEQSFSRFSPQPIKLDELLLTEEDFIDVGALFRRIHNSQKEQPQKKKRSAL
jgi:hypothetical protein